MRGVLVIDNAARGVGKGGTRMSPSPSPSLMEVARLARTMTWKWPAVALFHGGAKAGIIGDPHAPDKEAVLRAFARALANEVPAEYVFGLDMGLTEHDVFAMSSTQMRQNTLTVVTEARNRHLTTHAAAQRLSQERVRAAMMLRGQIPTGGRCDPR